MVIKPPLHWQDHLVLTFNGKYDTHIETGEDYATLALWTGVQKGPR